MNMIFVIAGLAAVYILINQFTGRRGKHFGSETLKSVLGIPLLTRGKFRWNELLTVREERPYVGTREAYIEGRTATYFLLGFIVVWVEQLRIEVPTNTLTRVMFLGEQLDGQQMDANFPPYLAYGKNLGKCGAMFGPG